MWEFFSHLGFWLILVGLPMLGWIIIELAERWRKVRMSEHLAVLKQSMIERGMSAEEIERVLKADGPSKEPAETSA